MGKLLVELSIGGQSQKVIASLKKSIDNVDFYTHSAMPAFIKEAESRKLSFKRIVMTPAILSKKAGKDFKKLNEYIKKYSPNTEVVLFTANENRIEVFEEFEKIFNSPLYTYINLASVTVVNIAKLVTATIEEIDSMEGGKNYGKSEEVVNPPESTPITSENTGGSPPVSLEKTPIEQPVNQPVNMGGVEPNNMFESQGKGFDFGFISETPTLAGSDFSGVGNSGIGCEEDDLSLGGFGNSHSDTGYLDEVEEEQDEELQEFLRNKEQQAVIEEPKKAQSSPVKKVKPPKKDISVPIVNPEEVEEPKVNANRPNIDLVISARGIGATQTIVDQAVQIVSQDKVKVLIIDLDSVNNGLLSFVDTDRFYIESAYEGISKQRVYEEDGVGVVSNGYGYKVKPKELKNFLLSKTLEDYEMVYIDCPMDCLYSLDVEILSMLSNILVMTGSDLSQMIATSLALTCREVVSVAVERYIMSNCYIEFVGAVDSKNINYVKERCLFANGSWLSRIGL